MGVSGTTSGTTAQPEVLLIAATYSVKIVSNQQIGQKKRFRLGLFLTLHLLYLDGAFMWLPVTGRPTDNQVGALLTDFRFVEASHFGRLGMLRGYN